jgi:hypothetical protein
MRVATAAPDPADPKRRQRLRSDAIPIGEPYRVAGTRGGLAPPILAATDRWAKSAGRAATQAAKCLALVQAVERRESERSAGRTRYRVVG